MEARTRNHTIDILRVIVTLLVIFHHYQQLTGVWFSTGLNFYGGKVELGLVVVLFFFFLSGYFTVSVIPKVDTELKFKTYYLGKIKRLLPMVAISVAVYELLLLLFRYICVGETWLLGTDIKVWGSIATAIGIQEGWVIDNPFVNNPTWYISVLLLCYIWFYFLTYVGKCKKIPVDYLYVGMIFLGMSIYTTGFYTTGLDLPFMNGSSATGYVAFFSGLLLGMFCKDRKIGRLYRIGLLFLVIILSGISHFRYGWVDDGFMYILCFVYFPSMILLAESDVLKKLDRVRILGELGKITYDVYIWHIPIFLALRILNTMFGLQFNWFSRTFMILYAVLSFGVGTVAHYVIEKPLMKRLGK